MAGQRRPCRAAAGCVPDSRGGVPDAARVDSLWHVSGVLPSAQGPRPSWPGPPWPPLSDDDFDDLVALAARCLAADGGLPLVDRPRLSAPAVDHAVQRVVRDAGGRLIAAGAVRRRRGRSARWSIRPRAARGSARGCCDWGLADRPPAAGHGRDRVAHAGRRGAVRVPRPAADLRRGRHADRPDRRPSRQRYGPTARVLATWSDATAPRFAPCTRPRSGSGPASRAPAAEWIAEWPRTRTSARDWSVLATVPEPATPDSSPPRSAGSCRSAWCQRPAARPRRGAGHRVAGPGCGPTAQTEAWLDVDVDNRGGRLYRRLGFNRRPTRPLPPLTPSAGRARTARHPPPILESWSANRAQVALRRLYLRGRVSSPGGRGHVDEVLDDGGVGEVRPDERRATARTVRCRGSSPGAPRRSPTRPAARTATATRCRGSSGPTAARRAGEDRVALAVAAANASSWPGSTSMRATSRTMRGSLPRSGRQRLAGPRMPTRVGHRSGTVPESDPPRGSWHRSGDVPIGVRRVAARYVRADVRKLRRRWAHNGQAVGGEYSSAPVSSTRSSPFAGRARGRRSSPARPGAAEETSDSRTSLCARDRPGAAAALNRVCRRSEVERVRLGLDRHPGRPGRRAGRRPADRRPAAARAQHARGRPAGSASTSGWRCSSASGSGHLGRPVRG